MNIKIRTVYNLQTFRYFQKYSFKKIFILAYISAILLVDIGIYFLHLELKSASIYILMGIVFPIMMHIYYKAIEINALNRNPYLKKTLTQLFTFDEDGVFLEQITMDNTFKDKYLYSDILSVIKYKSYYFIYVNRSQAFVILNEDYICGNEKELDNLFKSKLNDSFIKKGKHKKRKV